MLYPHFTYSYSTSKPPTSPRMSNYPDLPQIAPTYPENTLTYPDSPYLPREYPNLPQLFQLTQLSPDIPLSSFP